MGTSWLNGEVSPAAWFTDDGFKTTVSGPILLAKTETDTSWIEKITANRNMGNTNFVTRFFIADS